MSPRMLITGSLLALCSGGHATSAASCAASAEAACFGDQEEVHLLQHGAARRAKPLIANPQLGTDVASPMDALETARRPLAPALVDAVYTYGAPATHVEPFRNAASEDGCFPGLRSYTENLLGVRNSIHQVDAAAVNNYYSHALTNLLILRSGMDSSYTPCNPPEQDGRPDQPKRGAPQVYEHWPIHKEPKYQGRFDEITFNDQELVDEEVIKTAREFVLFAWRAYETIADITHALAERMPDWKLVGREVYQAYNDDDPVLVMQHAGSLDCALVFCGSNNFADFPSSTTKRKAAYCGFEGVHVGYRDELSRLATHLWPKLRPVLEQCGKVTSIGHSLGGALAELFAACANSGNTTDPDFQLLAWEKAKSPKQMPGLKA